MTTFVRILRVSMVIAITAAIGANLYGDIKIDDFAFFNFFGFFTIQSNLIGIAAFAVALRYTAQERPQWVEVLRASAVVYLTIVGTVYWTLLSDQAADAHYIWANLIVHGLSTIAIIVDWLVEGPRTTLPAKTVRIVLAYPAVWLIVVIIRGATDGWVPYPFLDPVDGYLSVAVVIVGIVAVGSALALITFKLTKHRSVTPAE